MSAPIPNTCPDINSIQYDIEEQYKLLGKTIDLLNSDNEPNSTIVSAISNIEDAMSGLEPMFTERRYSWHKPNPLEALREANATLRGYGEDMEEQRDQLDDQVSTLEAEVESLEYQLKKSNEENADLQKQLDEESNRCVALEDEINQLKASLMMYIK